MVFLQIDKKNCIDGKCNMINKLDNYLGDKNNKTFILIFMEGCGPCNATRPEWTKIQNVLSPNFLKRDDIIIASIDHTLAEKLKNIEAPSSFPTMRFITNGGKDIENYEDSSMNRKDRTIDSFIEWIKLKTGEENISKSENKFKEHYKHANKNINKNKIKTRKNKTIYKKNKKLIGGKWTLKYKRSINCKRPKGFSQKQYCKYGRHK
jgi:hypothetical protein